MAKKRPRYGNPQKQQSMPKNKPTPRPTQRARKPLTAQWWFWVLIVLALSILMSVMQ